MRRSLTLLLTTIAFMISPLSCLAADSDQKPADDQAQTKSDDASGKTPTIEEMHAHRRVLREDLMFPSLKGIRGVAFGVPGAHPEPELEKVVEGRLKQLPIMVKRYQDLEPGVTKPIDGFLQVKVLSAGPRFALVELTLTQWCALLRNPDINVRTITYHDQAVTNTKLVKETVISLVNQFVIDYMKANQSENSSADKTGEDNKRKKG